MSLLSEFCEETEALLLSSTINQQSINPDTPHTLKNHFVNLFLRRFLPSTIQIGSGEIIDHFGTRSTHQKLILHRSDFPIFPTTTASKIFLMEGVLASIEILQPSDNLDLTEPFLRSASVKTLKTGRHRILTDNSLDYMQQTLRLKPKTYIFSFGSQDDHQTSIENYNKAKQTSNAVVPDGVCFIGKNEFFAQYDPYKRKTIFYTDQPFTRFFEHLFQILVGEINSNNLKHDHNASIKYDLSNYLFFTPSSSSIG